MKYLCKKGNIKVVAGFFLKFIYSKGTQKTQKYKKGISFSTLSREIALPGTSQYAYSTQLERGL